MPNAPGKPCRAPGLVVHVDRDELVVDGGVAVPVVEAGGTDEDRQFGPDGDGVAVDGHRQYRISVPRDVLTVSPR